MKKVGKMVQFQIDNNGQHPRIWALDSRGNFFYRTFQDARWIPMGGLENIKTKKD